MIEVSEFQQKQKRVFHDDSKTKYKIYTCFVDFVADDDDIIVIETVDTTTTMMMVAL